MDNRHDRLRHGRVAHHASIRRKKSQILEAHVPSGHVKASTSRARASPHTSLSSSRKRRVSPTDASLHSSSRRCQISHIQASEIPNSLVVPKAPPTVDIADAFRATWMGILCGSSGCHIYIWCMLLQKIRQGQLIMRY